MTSCFKDTIRKMNSVSAHWLTKASCRKANPQHELKEKHARKHYFCALMGNKKIKRTEKSSYTESWNIRDSDSSPLHYRQPEFSLHWYQLFPSQGKRNWYWASVTQWFWKGNKKNKNTNLSSNLTTINNIS